MCYIVKYAKVASALHFTQTHTHMIPPVISTLSRLPANSDLPSENWGDSTDGWLPWRVSTIYSGYT